MINFERNVLQCEVSALYKRTFSVKELVIEINEAVKFYISWTSMLRTGNLWALSRKLQ